MKSAKHLKAHGGERWTLSPKLKISKGLNNFDEILEASDGIMVARGDLGVEIPVEEVIFAQKMMIEKCIRARKVVITADSDAGFYDQKPASDPCRSRRRG
ncbi:pyruvate kinase [Escherichia coli]